MNENIIYDILGHTVQRDPGDIKNLPTSMHLIDIGLKFIELYSFYS